MQILALIFLVAKKFNFSCPDAPSRIKSYPDAVYIMERELTNKYLRFKFVTNKLTIDSDSIVIIWARALVHFLHK